jgi:hypothetical protein
MKTLDRNLDRDLDRTTRGHDVPVERAPDRAMARAAAHPVLARATPAIRGGTTDATPHDAGGAFGAAINSGLARRVFRSVPDPSTLPIPPRMQLREPMSRPPADLAHPERALGGGVLAHFQMPAPANHPLDAQAVQEILAQLRHGPTGASPHGRRRQGARPGPQPPAPAQNLDAPAGTEPPGVEPPQAAMADPLSYTVTITAHGTGLTSRRRREVNQPTQESAVECRHYVSAANEPSVGVQLQPLAGPMELVWDRPPSPAILQAVVPLLTAHVRNRSALDEHRRCQDRVQVTAGATAQVGVDGSDPHVDTSIGVVWNVTTSIQINFNTAPVVTVNPTGASVHVAPLSVTVTGTF